MAGGFYRSTTRYFASFLGQALCLIVAGCALSQAPAPSMEEGSQSLPAARPTMGAELRIAAVGDIMLGGTATAELRRFGYDYPFQHVRHWLAGAHIAFANLEGPLTDGGEPYQAKQYVFRSPPAEVAPALRRAGISIVSLANNHSLDYGLTGLADTTAALAAAGIRYAGVGRDARSARAPVFLQANGLTVAFLAYSLTFPEEFWATDDKPGTAFGHEEHVREDVARARSQADLVVVSFHWGQEGKTTLRDYQMLLGRAAIDAGAAAVIGHHPHVLQAVEHYRDGVILYSLGNFVFGSYSPMATRSAIALLTFRDHRLVSVRLIPLNVKNTEVVFQTQPLKGEEAEALISELQRLSEPLGTRLENDSGTAVLKLVPATDR